MDASKFADIGLIALEGIGTKPRRWRSGTSSMVVSRHLRAHPPSLGLLASAKSWRPPTHRWATLPTVAYVCCEKAARPPACES